ncbi:hypothetical protein [Methylomagnum sp.]
MRRHTPLTASVKLSRMGQTAAALRKAGEKIRLQGMKNAEAALKRDRGEEPETEETE